MLLSCFREVIPQEIVLVQPTNNLVRKGRRDVYFGRQVLRFEAWAAAIHAKRAELVSRKSLASTCTSTQASPADALEEPVGA